MNVRNFLSLICLLAASLQGQTVQPKKPPAKQENQCSTALKATSQAVDALSADIAASRAENERLRKENQELAARAAESDKKLADLRDAALKVYNESVQVNQAFKKTVDDNAALTDKYNDLLGRANSIINSQNARLARQQQVYNALTMYSMLPKSQPYVLPQPIVPQSAPPPVNLNCTTTNVGGTAYTNCH